MAVINSKVAGSFLLGVITAIFASWVVDWQHVHHIGFQKTASRRTSRTFQTAPIPSRFRANMYYHFCAEVASSCNFFLICAA